MSGEEGATVADPTARLAVVLRAVRLGDTAAWERARSRTAWVAATGAAARVALRAAEGETGAGVKSGRPASSTRGATSLRRLARTTAATERLAVGGDARRVGAAVSAVSGGGATGCARSKVTGARSGRAAAAGRGTTDR